MNDSHVNSSRRKRLGYRRLKSYADRRPEETESAGGEGSAAPPPAPPQESWKQVAAFAAESLPTFLANKLRYSFLYKTFGFLIVVFCVFISSFLAVTYSQVKVVIHKTQEIAARQPRLLFLVLGADDMKRARGRSDAIMLVHVDFETLEIRALSVPRDSYVELDHRGKSMDKVNHAYFFGGPDLARKTIENYVGVQVDYYGVINYALFERVVDLAGGVPIDVEKRMDYDDNAGNLHIHLRKGPQVLDGNQAKGYVRFRKDALGDIGRMQRQQKFAKALLAKLKSPKVIALLAVNFQTLFEYVKTDVPLDVALGLLYQFRDFDPRNIELKAIPATPRKMYAPRYGKKLHFLVSDPQDVTESRDWLLSLAREPETTAAPVPASAVQTPSAAVLPVRP